MDQSAKRTTPAGRRRAPRPADGRMAAPTRRVVLKVVDVRRPSVAAALKRASLALRSDAADRDALDFIDRAADRSGWR